MEEVGEEIRLSGFDPDGEPSIRRTDTGCLWLCFEFMPPLWAPEEEHMELGRWEDFDKQLEQAIGVPVVWEDREQFRIDHPRVDTVEKIQQFLMDVRKRYETVR